MINRDPTFDIDQMQRTMRHLYLDDRWPNRDTKIAGIGVATTAASTCGHCSRQGYYARNCWKRKDDNDSRSSGAHNKQKNNQYSNSKAVSKVGGEHEWYSVNKTASYCDTECYKQGASRPPRSRRAHTTNAVPGASTRPIKNEKPSFNWDDGSKEGSRLPGY